MAIDDVAPAGFIEGFAVGGKEVAGLIDIRVGDGRTQGLLEDRLQAEEHGAVMDAAAGFHIEEGGASVPGGYCSQWLAL